jgi:hypothetical protein
MTLYASAYLEATIPQLVVNHSSAIESMQCNARVVLSTRTVLSVCSQAYPALFELVTALHGLPFELNAKAPSLQLSQPIPGSTMLSKLPAGGEVHRRLDSVVGGGQTTGYAVTAGMHHCADHILQAL